MNKKNIHIIINPTAGGGKTGESRQFILSKIEKYLGTEYTLWVTGKPAEAVDHAVKAIESGGNLILAVGGDGTIHEVVNGICSKGVDQSNECILGIISSGTGQDFVQSLGMTTNIDDQLRTIKEGHVELIDVGRLKYNDSEGNEKTEFFANEFQIGIGGDVVKKVNAKKKRKSGFLTYGLATTALLFNYKAHQLTLQIDNDLPVTDKYIGVIAANGNYMGGGMKIIPYRRLNDQLFELLLVKDQNIFQKMVNFPKIYFGKLKNTTKINFQTIKKIKISSNENVLMEADGELLGSLPCEVELIPSALKVCAKFDAV